jgi:phosphoglycolate phosphatase-like HAD superfamily hydrolase
MDLRKFNSSYKYEVYIFDLDNTIYDESVYLFAAYQSIADYVESNIGGSSEEYGYYLINTFKSEGREKLFEKFLFYFRLQSLIELKDLLNILRQTKVVLKIDNKMKILMQRILLNGKKVYILTNGNPIQQKNKLSQLNIQDLLENIQIIYANEYEPKPSPFCINMIIEKENVQTKDIVFIGDSDVDEETAKNADINFINVNFFEL